MSKLKLFLIFKLIILMLMTDLAVARSTAIGPEGFADLVEQLTPAVVNISTTQKISFTNKRFSNMPEGSPFEDFYDFFERFGLIPPNMDGDDRQNSRKAVSLGSGFIIDQSGYIVTNHHVIAEAEEITVKLYNDKQLKAKLIGFDIKTDLALLKVESDNLPTVTFGDSDSARVGEWVLAIGNPFGLGGTVTAGIISARMRDINAGGIVDNFIQTDAAINKGNSGGPMFNMKGEVIGINTAIFSPSEAGGNVGIGFATPSSLARSIIEQLRTTGKVQRSWLGVKIQPVDEEVSESLGLKEAKGALVAEVSKDSPADKAHIQAGDVILKFDNKDVTTTRKLPRLVAETPIGKKVEIKLLRNGSEKTVNVNLAELNENYAKDGVLGEEDNSLGNRNESKEFYGIYFSKITPETRENYNLPIKQTGLIITKFAKSGLWLKRGLQRGDIITTVNQQPLNNIEDLDKAIKKALADNRKSILCQLNRNGNYVFITLPIAK
ncbi:MAG: DegQ family serine endoprotease [Alphaproteobacteria bacterium]